MNRLYAAVGALLVILVLGWVALDQYQGKVVASVNADIATKVVTEAVAANTKQAVRDYQAQGKKAVALDSVRSATQNLKEFNEKPPESIDVGAPDPWIRVFNDAVRRTNRAVEHSVDMP